MKFRRPRFDPLVAKIPFRREWQPTPVFLPREFHGQTMGSQNVRHNWTTNACTYTWAFFFIAILWDWNENWPISVHYWVFQICWHIECNTLTPSSSRIWNRSSGIPSLPLPLFIVMFLKSHLTSQSMTFGTKWVNTPWWLSRLLR